MSRIGQKVRDWMLPIAMLTGASIYLVYHALPAPFHKAGPFLSDFVGVLQPCLIFSMLFLTFCRIEPRDLKPHRWHVWLLLIQGGSFTLLGLAAYSILRWMPEGHHDWVILIESAMLCLICPTATAAAVVTRKLGGDVAGITTYTVLINLVVALLVPLVVPMIQPVEGLSFFIAFSMILAKIFPLLILPCLAAWLVRYLLPKLHRRLLEYPDLAFYIWAVSLTLAITVSVKYLMASTLALGMIGLMALVSLVCCVLQFALGRYVGNQYRPRRQKTALTEGGQPVTESGFDAMIFRGKQIRKVTAGQALGQKNTVFAIWMAYTFMTPETAIIGGLYSIWHNVFNSWQLYRAARVHPQNDKLT